MAGTPPTVRTLATNGNTASATSISVTCPTVSTGELLIAFFGLRDRNETSPAPSWSGVGTWTKLGQVQSTPSTGSSHIAASYVVADSTDGGKSITVTHSFDVSMMTVYVVQDWESTIAPSIWGSAAVNNTSPVVLPDAAAAGTNPYLYLARVQCGFGDAEPFSWTTTNGVGTDYPTVEQTYATGAAASHIAVEDRSDGLEDGSSGHVGASIATTARTDRTIATMGVAIAGVLAGGGHTFGASGGRFVRGGGMMLRSGA